MQDAQAVLDQLGVDVPQERQELALELANTEWFQLLPISVQKTLFRLPPEDDDYILRTLVSYNHDETDSVGFIITVGIIDYVVVLCECGETHIEVVTAESAMILEEGFPSIGLFGSMGLFDQPGLPVWL